MQSHVSLNGSKTKKGNYVWGAALTLAWKQLCKQIIKQPIRINSENQLALRTTQNFNKSPFDFRMLDEKCYYARAGYGNETVNKINQQVSKKFPEKTTQKLEPNLSPDAIISYAYFFKKMKFHQPFTKSQVIFNQNYADGFQASNAQQRKQILVHNYKDDQNFVIQLKTKAQQDHIFIIKSHKQLNPQDALEKVSKISKKGQLIGSSDVFRMPKIKLSHKRDVGELIGVYLANEKFKQYFFSQIYEIIKLDLDEEGVKVENEGVIIMERCAMVSMHQPRRFILDKPFWIVMRQKQNHPYFVAYIRELHDE